MSNEDRDVQWRISRRWRRQLEQERPACRDAFAELLDSGCEEEQLVFVYLANLKSSLNRTRKSRGDIVQLAKMLDRCSKSLQNFRQSSIAGVLDGEGHARVLVVGLRGFAAHLRKAGQPGAERNYWESRALMLLEDYVREATDKPHHDALDVLASAVLGRSVSVRERVARHRKQFAGASGARPKRPSE